MPISPLLVRSPVEGDAWSWRLSNEDGVYRVDAMTEDGFTVRLASVISDLSAGGYSKNHVAMASLIVAAPVLAASADSLCDEFALHEQNMGGCRIRGDEVETVQYLRDASAYLRTRTGKQGRMVYLTGKDTPAAPWTPFTPEFEALRLRTPKTASLPDAFPLQLPFRVGPSGDARQLPWGEICDAQQDNVLSINADALKSSRAEPQATAFFRAVEVAPHLLAGSLRLINAAQMEIDLYEHDLRRDEFDGFQRAAETAEMYIGQFCYPNIGRVLEAGQTLRLLENRNELAAAAANLLQASPGSEAYRTHRLQVGQVAGGLLRSESRVRTRAELDEQASSRSAAELAIASAHGAGFPSPV